MASTWSDTPKLKACFKDKDHALEIFEKELRKNLHELQNSGLFFSFTTDPFLPALFEFHIQAISICCQNDVPVKILTKRGDFQGALIYYADVAEWDKSQIAIGFTLTGHDELEPNASTNAERIEAMRKLHAAGFKTWASIEPIIDIQMSSRMIGESYEFCDLYKVGILSGKKYDKNELAELIRWSSGCNKPFYFKDSLLQQAGINREDLPENCVGRDCNLFTN